MKKTTTNVTIPADPTSTTMMWAVINTQMNCFMGRYCWAGASQKDPPVPLFTSKKLCKAAIKEMTCYRGECVPVRVVQNIQQLSTP